MSRCLCTSRHRCTPTEALAAIEHLRGPQANVELQTIAARMVMDPRRLARLTNPDDREKFPLELLSDYMRAAQSTLPLDVLCREMGGVFVQLPDAATTDDDIYAAVLKQAEELGQASERIRKALSADSDGGLALTLTEAQECARELDDVAAAAMSAKAVVLARISAKPAAVRMQLEPPTSARRTA